MVEQDWFDSAGQPIHCTGKLRVLRENEEELRQVIKEACADALLMDVAPAYLRQHMEQLMAAIVAEAIEGTKSTNGADAMEQGEG